MPAALLRPFARIFTLRSARAFGTGVRRRSRPSYCLRSDARRRCLGRCMGNGLFFFSIQSECNDANRRSHRPSLLRRRRMFVELRARRACSMQQTAAVRVDTRSFDKRRFGGKL